MISNPLIIVGSAPGWEDELADAFLPYASEDPQYLALNHQGYKIPIVDYWATLHPDHMLAEDWLRLRRETYPALVAMFPSKVIIPRAYPDLGDQLVYSAGACHGSVALYATRWAIRVGYQKLILAGVHLGPDYAQFREGWQMSTGVLQQAHVTAKGGWLKDYLAGLYE